MPRTKGSPKLGRLSRLSIRRVLVWADEHRRRTGEWPTQYGGEVFAAPLERWSRINACLVNGHRGLPGGLSLPQLLKRERNRPNKADRPPLTAALIGRWASSFHARHGRWPRQDDGVIPESDGDTWSAVQAALARGLRGLKPNQSLGGVLRRECNARTWLRPPSINLPTVMRWAKAHHARTGRWPDRSSGVVVEDPPTTWNALELAFLNGTRGLPGGRPMREYLIELCGMRDRFNLPDLDVDRIVAWAKQHHQRTGAWPDARAGAIAGSGGETWSVVSDALLRGRRGLNTVTSLGNLLRDRCGVFDRKHRPPLTDELVVRWAKAHHARTGAWPSAKSGAVHESDGETWIAVASAYANGARGLQRSMSLPKLLLERCGVPSTGHRPPLTDALILRWAKAHHARNGAWPTAKTGAVQGQQGETWQNLDRALTDGLRGLSPGRSIARLLAEHGLKENRLQQERLTISRILRWADIFHERTGGWPRRASRNLSVLPGVRWSSIESALANGGRGLTGGSSLAQLLDEHRGVRNPRRQPPLTTRQILAWADDQHRRTGRWPTQYDGEVAAAPQERWSRINHYLFLGRRGLPGGQTIAQLLQQQRSRPNRSDRPRLTNPLIGKWASAFHARRARWPRQRDGAIPESPGDTWSAIQAALARGLRGLKPNQSLGGVLKCECNARIHRQPPDITLPTLLRWARAHHARTGSWPSQNSGKVVEDPASSWNALSTACIQGKRGLPKGIPLYKHLIKHCGKRDRFNPPPLTLNQIVKWAEHHFEQTGDWPAQKSGRVLADREENWGGICKALAQGTRGLAPRQRLSAILGKRHPLEYGRRLKPLDIDRILEWAIDHHELHGRLPSAESGTVEGEPGEHWKAIDAALRVGRRNLSGRSSLERLFKSRYEPPYSGIGRRLTEALIADWARDFHERVGRWPTARSAFVHGRPIHRRAGEGERHAGERWIVLDECLRRGTRGLPGGSSLERVVRAARTADAHGRRRTRSR